MVNIQVEKLKNVTPVTKGLNGTIKVPSDKSISHRAAMFGALTQQPVQIMNFSAGGDCKSTLEVLKGLGVEVTYQAENNITIFNNGGFKEPANVLDAGNSGTTIRLMSGILSGSNFYSVLTGDESLRKRPMARIINPLSQMGARIFAKNANTKAPITIIGTELHGITYNSPIASAQIKSAMILAGLSAQGETVITEPFKSRDHSERMLQYLCADLTVDDNKITVKKSELAPKTLIIPGDISSAAFFLVAGAIIPDSEILIKDVGLNPTRTGIIDILKKMGADITIEEHRIECGEDMGDVRIRYSQLKGIEIEEEIIPRVIDELPIIAVAATQAEGTTVIRGAEDLRHKESDRIVAICTELKKLGADIQETPDGFIVNGKTKLKGNCILNTYHDHRIAMSGYVAGLLCEEPIQICEFEWVNISFPEFPGIFEKLTQ
ncbi:MAG: 3-phosphoshikimate 1-carboxyvinyltransferase [bacterium]